MAKLLPQITLLLMLTLIGACDGKASIDDERTRLDASPSTDTNRDALDNDASKKPDASQNSDAGDVLTWDTPPDDNGIPPLISNFRVTDAQKDRVFFDSDKPISGSDVSGFTISGKIISEVVIVPNQPTGHYFRLLEALDFWDNNTIRYEGGSDIKDVADRPLVEFVLHYVENLISEPDANTDRYVTTGAAGGNDGTSEGNAWTIEEGFDNAAPGMTVWIKAGDYGNPNLEVPTSGEVNNPIKFVGYKANIGDITSMYYTYGDGDLKPAEMPFLDGQGVGGTAAIVGGGVDYYIIRNIQVQRYEVGIYNNSGEGVMFDNTLFKDGSITNPNDMDGDFGYGIVFLDGPTRSRITNSTAINATGTNFTAGGTHNLMKNLKSYSNNFTNPTDYYFGTSGSNNISLNTYAKRDGDLSHSGHGMSVQTSAVVSNEPDPGRTEYNLIQDHTGVNLAKIMELRHGGVKYNVGRNIVGYPEGAGSDGASSIEIRDNAGFNVIENANIEAPNGVCIYFSESVEIGVGLGHDNIIRNLVCKNAVNAFYVAADAGVGSLTNNKIYNSVFYNVESLFDFRDDTYELSGNEFKNNIVVNTPVLSNIPVLGWVFESSDFYDGFAVPAGDGNVSVNPNFVSDTDFHFGPNSPTEVIEGGQSLPPAVDVEGNVRTPPYSMGVYEY